MNLETILNAMTIATQEYYKKSYDIKYLERTLRQIRAFRDRIIRLDERNKMRIAELEGYIDDHDCFSGIINSLES